MSALGQKRTHARNMSCPLYPQKRTCAVQLGMSALGQERTHVQQKGSLFDHRVGATLQRLRYGNAERLCGLEIDDQFDFLVCTTGRSAGFSPLRIFPA
jgi:hypothetical protein